MPAIVLYFTTEIEDLDIVGAASAAKKAGFIRGPSRSHRSQAWPAPTHTGSVCPFGIDLFTTASHGSPAGLHRVR